MYCRGSERDFRLSDLRKACWQNTKITQYLLKNMLQNLVNEAVRNQLANFNMNSNFNERNPYNSRDPRNSWNRQSLNVRNTGRGIIQLLI